MRLFLTRDSGEVIESWTADCDDGGVVDALETLKTRYNASQQKWAGQAIIEALKTAVQRVERSDRRIQ